MAVSEALAPGELGVADVPAALALSDAAGWNQTAADWALFIEHGRVLGLRRDGTEWVATAAALPYGDGQGWISMVLVQPAWQHRGLASRLLGACVDGLRQVGITPVLDATPAGEPVYRRLGFQPGLAFERWQADLQPGRDPIDASDGATPDSAGTRVAGSERLDEIVALDFAANAIRRRFLLRSFMARPDTRAWMTHDGRGFVLRRAGRRATQIGPLAAADTPAAMALLEAALAQLRGPVFLDVASRRDALMPWLRARGFSPQRPFVRMALGAATALSGSDQQFVMAGPEFG